ncbi:hypothetical protein FSP39_024190 [Pinctada imbricata]|uniref:Uncharacterized protein n=1 Tax=Pinctada imbricata TaxID=66713 RepID=A0AA88Y976_PINIB|nr:hypothetical protein FSP39_024190 [Pinctada imbricata]
MNIHAFIERLGKDRNNGELVKDIADSFKVLKEKRNNNLILEIPAKQGDGNESEAKFIHGNIFEEYVLQAAVEDQRMKFNVIGENEASVNSKIQSREKMFNGIYGIMQDKYKGTMINSGSDAWGILSKIFAHQSAYKDTEKPKPKLEFEKTIPNTRTTLLTKRLRADLVAKIGSKVFIVDFKYSSSDDRKEYETKWLVNGFIQVLIYGILIGEKPCNLSLWLLVYYAQKGQIVLYSTYRKRNKRFVRMLKKIAKIPDEHDDEDGEDDEDDILQSIRILYL